MTPEDILRQAFEAQASRVEVAPEALPSIRARIRSRRSRQRKVVTMSLASLATGAAASLTAIVVGVGSCAPVAPGPAPTPPVPATAPTTAPDAGPTTPPAATTARLPVYFIGVVRTRPVLYREWHTLPAADGSPVAKTRAALTHMFSGEAADPDYASSWPASAAVRDVRVEGDRVTVDLTGAAVNGAGSAYAQQAVQQLVWTTTAVTGARRVRLLLDGRPVSELWGHVDTSGDLERGPALDTLAPVWLISPQHGDSVGPTFNVHIDGTVFEATAQLWVRDATGAVRQTFTVTLDAGPPARGEKIFPVTLTLPAGQYSLEAFYFSAQDGSRQAIDDHEITVR